MSRRGKYILFLFLAVLFLGPGLVMIFNPVIDLSPYRQQLSTSLSKSLQRKLELHGSVFIRLGLKPVVTMAGFSITNPDWCRSRHLVQSGAAELGIDLSALLHGELRIEQFVLHSTSINLEQNIDNQNNWTFAAGNGESPIVIVNDMTLADIDIRLHTPTFKKHLRIEQARLQSEAPYYYNLDITGALDKQNLLLHLESNRWPFMASRQPLKIQLSTSLLENQLSARLEVPQFSPKLEAIFQVEAEKINLDEIMRHLPQSGKQEKGGAGNDSFHFAMADPFLAMVHHLSVAVNIKQLRYKTYALRNLKWQGDLARATPRKTSTLVLHAEGKLTQVFAEHQVTGVIKGGDVSLSLQAHGHTLNEILSGTELALSAHDFTGNVPGPYQIKQLVLTTDKVGALSLTSEIDYNHGPVRLTATSGEHLFGQLLQKHNSKLSLQLETGQSRLTADASLQDLMQGERRVVDMTVTGKYLSDWTHLLNTDLPPVPDYTIGGRLEWLHRGISIKNLAVSSRDSRVHARLSYRTDKRDTLNLTIRNSRLALSDLGPVSTAAAKKSGHDDKVIPTKLIPPFNLFSFLSPSLDFNIDVDASAILFSSSRIDGLNMQTQWHDGLFYSQIKQGTITGGKLKGEIYLSRLADEAAGKIELTLTQLDYGKLLKEFNVGDKMQGQADINVYVVGFGVELSDFLSHADGSIEIVGGKGVLVDKYLRLWGEDIVRQIIPTDWFEQDETNMNCVVGRFELQEGKLKNDSLLLDTEHVTMAGVGAINLVSEELEFVFTPDPKKASLFSLATPVKIGGTLAKPELKAHKLGTAWTIGSLLAGLSNPALLLTRFAKLGSLGENPCLAAIGKKEGKGESSVLKHFKDAVKFIQRPLDKLPDVE